MKLIAIIIILLIILFITYKFYNRENFNTINDVSQEYYAGGNFGNFKINNIIVSESFNVIPSGLIIAWNGSSFSVPSGWLICDGTNGTPDLRSRFIVGAGQGTGLTNYIVGEEGGNENITLSINQIPNHTHQLPLDNACFENGGCDARTTINFSGSANPGASSPPPNAPYNITNAGGGQPHENRPPYYSLFFIMKK